MARFGKWQRFHSSRSQSGLLVRLYDIIVGYTQVGAFGRSLWFKKILKQYSLRPKNVLDAGCGKGDYTYYFAEKYPETHITGVDVDPEIIAEVKQLQKRTGLNNITFREKDLRKLEEKEVYDFVFTIDVFQYNQEKRVILENFHQVLIPQGLLYIRIPCFKQKRIFYEKFFDHHQIKEYWTLNPKLSFHYDLHGLIRDLQDIGFNLLFSSYTNGFWGRLSFELGYILKSISRTLFALSLPFLKLLSYGDILKIPKNSGNGIVVLGQKVKKSDLHGIVS